MTSYAKDNQPSWGNLLIAVFIQACRDVKGNDFVKALDAALWLVSEDARILLDAVDFEGDPLTLLTSGQIKKARIRKA